MEQERVVFLDWLRVIACFLVILTHCNEPVYLGGSGTFVASHADALWSTFFVSLCRCCVPLFILASSYLLFPVDMPAGQFYGRRIRRVAIPALVWLVLYCIFGGGELKDNFTSLIFNFSAPAGHLWFCYMIIGLYLAMPLLSPWAEKAGKKELQTVLMIWIFPCLIPMVRAIRMFIDGHWSVWGEANWSEFGMFYYVSGYMGYVLLGLYFKKYVPELSWKKTLSIAIPCFIIGFLGAAVWFYWQMPKNFPVDRPLETAVHMEVLLRNCTVSVLMMTIGVFLIIKKFTSCGCFYDRFVLPVSKASYGIYLMHIFILIPVYGMYREFFGGYGFEGGLLEGTIWATPVVVVCSAVTTFLGASVISCAARKITLMRQYLIG